MSPPAFSERNVYADGPIGMQIHSQIGAFDHKDIRVEEDPKEDRLITVK